MSKIDKNPVGHINLKDILHINVSKINSLNSGVTWGFELTVPNRVYHLYASSEQERLFWIEGLTSKITKVKKSDEKGGLVGFMKELQIKKDGSPSSSPYKVINEYASGSVISNSSFNGNDDTDEEPDSEMSANLSTLSNKTRLEKELENKENIIGKLKEEKLAFEQYAKELADEKAQILMENKIMMEKLDTQSKDLLEKKILNLEIEIQELKQDMQVLYFDLSEEKELTENLIKEKAHLEKVFNSEKKDLENKAEEYQSAKIKAIELMNSGSYETKESKTTNWSLLFLNLQRASSKYRKERDEYYQKNTRLKKQMENILVLVEKQNPIICKYTESLEKLKKNKNEFESILGRITYCLPLYNSEVAQLLAFLSGSVSDIDSTTTSQSISTLNDLEFYDLIKNYKYQKNTLDEQYDFGWIDFSLNTSSSNFISNSSGENEPLIEGDTVQESKEILKKSVEYLENSLNTLTLGNQELLAKTLPQEYTEQIDNLFQVLESSNKKLIESKANLKQVELDINTLAIGLESRDEYEYKMEIIIDKMEPYLHGVSGVEDSDSLIKEIEKLSESLVSSTNSFKSQSADTDNKIKELEKTSDNVEELISSIFTNFFSHQQKTLLETLDGYLCQEKALIEQQVATPFKKLVHCLLSVKKKCILLKALDELQSKSTKAAAYKAQEDDQLDMMVESVINMFQQKDQQDSAAASAQDQYYDTPIQWVIPPNFQRIDHGSYLFGTKKISTSILAGGLVVRVGGGFMKFEDFVKKYGKIETIKIIKLPNRKSMSLNLKRQSMSFGSTKNLQSFSPDKKIINRPVSRTGNYQVV
ncbi:hypothetical protein CYY_004667 [Polysphondylium violaceum]|uniref:GAR domain-containing protein n=1 Tax=Polysphondylium violaceum TaxID=133409 RepID=A0A8J4PV16_9MYCE|nr:hypothetical protein CYY_004667 [Polysphondylium violaceum]